MDGRQSKLIAIFAIAVALVLGVVLGTATGIADRIFGGPKAETIASASLESMRAQNRLIAFRSSHKLPIPMRDCHRRRSKKLFWTPNICS